ncbi:hypothetical protein H8356DRAFT_1724122 [Neocallimastix lanati (nom. inval.)]|jgi:hypothetical protein|uniref:GDP/GTP exchange factor Sec2 N-terminal domain-containing protein n=1 Tax=Neocallimastix californiae TaxID=1754190 RepID=A0A1Y2C269_9FUNG|nr:hypothetical protein H8356DRAFT_1724122 [Neocallimastix sp. JGI-2020a]ORY41119.1 hypothetical protein LY90DRAFT_703994 [Neocallimastix californiae]|eukprot:ORY41119.1 hypothetical protein LY90DRAFT_703994 [Neocallimastix californiae]
MIRAVEIKDNEDNLISSNNKNGESENEILRPTSEIQTIKEDESENSMEKEKLKEDNERLKFDIEVLSKKLHDAVNRIGNLEKALENKSVSDSSTNNNGLTYSTTTTTTTTTTSSIQTGGKTYMNSTGPIITNDTSIIVKMKDLENTVDVLNRRLLEEVERRSELETSHSALVQETEDLTVKLFEEAQSMVAVERKENFEKEKQIKKLKSIVDEKDQIIQALMEENKTLKIYIQNSANKLNDSDSDVSSILNSTVEINNENYKEFNEENKNDDNNVQKDKVKVRTRALSNVNSILSNSPFSPINSILSVEKSSEDNLYQTFGFQTINKELYFDNKNPYYLEIYNFIKYKHYDVLEHARFMKRCITEEIDPCLDFQPINPDLLTITTKLSHYNCVRRIVRACKENTLIIKNLYEYPKNTENTNNENKNNKEIKENNVSCSLCLRNNLPLPLNRCYMDEEDKEIQSNDKSQTQSVYVCKYCKERLLSVYDYYGYMKFVRTSLKENKANEKPTEYCHNVFGDLLRIRERIYWAKFGLVGKDYGVNTSSY